MIKNKKLGWMLNSALFAVFLFVATTRVEAQNDFMKGFGALKGIVEQVQKNTSMAESPRTGTGESWIASNVPRNAGEYCNVVKSSPLVQAYLPVLSKAVNTKVTSFDPAIRDAIALRFDTADRKLKDWVEATPSPNGEIRKSSEGSFGRNTRAWASLCAAKNYDNDLFLFFLPDVSNPEAIAYRRGLAKTALQQYEASNGRTFMFDLGHADNEYSLSNPLWVTLSAFMLPNGAAMMQTTANGKASDLMAKIDQVVAINADRKMQAEREEADKAANQAKVVAGKEAYAASPNGLLQQAYQAMQSIQACSDARKGYAAIYVSDAELADAKNKMRRIEGALKPKITGETADQIWEKASTANANYIRGVKTAQYSNGRGYCDLFKRDLEDVANKVLGQETVKRTF